MPLRITKASDPITVDQIVLCIYGAPGTAKSSLAFTANDPLLFDFDRGVHRAMHRKDAVLPASWRDVTDMTAEDFRDYRTVIVDTAGRALDMLAADIIQRDAKMGRGGALTLQGFGKLKAEFTAWLKLLRSFGLDVVLIAHAEEKQQGDETIERIDAQGASKNEIYKSADAMARLVITGGKRVLLFSPTDTAFGKNPAEFEPLTVPRFAPDSTFLGDIIATIKAKLNAMSEEQREVSQLLAAWSEKVHKATSPKALNTLLTSADELDPRIRDNAKRLLWSFAKDHDFSFDTATKTFRSAA
jgi:hypothetical protein